MLGLHLGLKMLSLSFGLKMESEHFHYDLLIDEMKRSVY